MKNPEEHSLHILQLYIPCRNEDALTDKFNTYQERYDEVKHDISKNIERHEPFEEVELEEIENHLLTISDNEEDDDNADFSMFDLELIDLDHDSDNNLSPNVSVAATSQQTILLPNYQFYDMRFQLNFKQQLLFDFVMQYAVKCRYHERNNQSLPDAFYIFLSGGEVAGKSFLVTTVTQYLKRVLRFPGQLIDKQPSVLVTASTEKAATCQNGTTLDSAFWLPTETRSRTFQYKKTKDETFHEMRNRYKYLKVLIIDEISMVGCKTFQHLNLAMQLIMSNSSQFGGVSVIAIGDLLQLPPPVNQQGIYMCPKNGTYESFQGSVWQNLFVLH